MPILNPEESCRIVVPSPTSELLKNLKRSMSMLKKALYRVVRNNYHDRSQYPKVFFEIEKIINSILSWIDGYKNFVRLHNFSILLGFLIRDLSDLISQLIQVCKPVPGKKMVSKKKQIKAFEKKIDPILENIANFLAKLKNSATDISIKLEKWLIDEFKVFSTQIQEIKKKYHFQKEARRPIFFRVLIKKSIRNSLITRIVFDLKLLINSRIIHMPPAIKNLVKEMENTR